jgi:hypothetical protein
MAACYGRSTWSLDTAMTPRDLPGTMIVLVIGASVFGYTSTSAAANYARMKRVCGVIERSLPKNEAGLARLFGTPSSRVVESVPNNVVPTKPLQITRFKYSAATADIWKPADGRPDELVEVHVLTGASLPGLALKPGDAVSAVERLLGPPEERNGSDLTYSCSDESGPALTVRLGAGRVVEISWLNWPD